MKLVVYDACVIAAIGTALLILVLDGCRSADAGPVFGFDAARFGDAARDATERAAEPYKVDVKIRPKKIKPLFRWHQATSWAFR